MVRGQALDVRKREKAEESTESLPQDNHVWTAQSLVSGFKVKALEPHLSLANVRRLRQTLRSQDVSLRLQVRSPETEGGLLPSYIHTYTQFLL